MTDEPPVPADPEAKEDGAPEEKNLSRAAIMSYVMIPLAILSLGGVRLSALAALISLICLGAGAVSGVAGCIYGGSGKNFALGLGGIALNTLTFFAVVLFLTLSHG